MSFREIMVETLPPAVIYTLVAPTTARHNPGMKRRKKRDKAGTAKRRR
jgi:hypothetical protein